MNRFRLLILCYSGAGNSLLVASTIKDRLLKDGYDAQLKMINKKIGEVDLTPYDLIILVSPVYAYHAPGTVLEFMRSLKNGTSSFYLIFTKGLILGNSAYELHKILKEKGYKVRGFSDIILTDTLFLLTAKKNTLLEKFYLLPNKIFLYKLKTIYRSIIKAIHSQKEIRLHKKLYGLLTEFIAKKFWKKINTLKRLFYADGKCNLCGVCVQVCPRSNIRIEEGKVLFGDDCEFCTACIHRCPQEAVQVGKMTIGKARYKIGKEANYFRKVLN